MATQVQNRRGTTAEHSTFTGANGELTVDTTKRTLVVHDGATAGGRPLLREDQSNMPTSAPTTGIYNASGSLAISTGGSGRLFVDSSGRAGVGTASPISKLHVAGDSFFEDWIYSGNSKGISSDSASRPLLFGIGGTERARIDSSGRLLVGTSTARSNFFNGSVSAIQQIEGANSTDQRMVAQIYGSAAGDSAAYIFAKHRSTSIGGNTIVSNNDTLGLITFQGSDGAEFVPAAYIFAEVDGTPGANDMPGRLVFSTTADGASSPTERLYLYSNGYVRAPGVYALTTAVAADVRVDSDGYLYRSTSSIRYKKDVETLQDEYADAILNARPVWFRSLSEKDNPDWGYWGFIAEEVEQIDPRLCTYGEDEEGNQRVESVQYDRFVPHLLNLIKRQQQAIETLEAKVAALESV